MAQILKGPEVAQAISAKLTDKVKTLKAGDTEPKLAILRIGEEPDQVAYAKSAKKRCDAIGIAVQDITLPQNATQDETIKAIIEINDDTKIHGALILRPLPEHISDYDVRTTLEPKKDVDGITNASIADVFTGSKTGYAPCTAKACMEILDYYKIDPVGKRAVVVGRSLVIGKPVALMLMEKNATVTVCHSKTRDIPKITREADIVITAIGQAEKMTAEYFAPNQVVIDVGINWNSDTQKLCGDVKFLDAMPIVAAITPVPGGVGAVTTAVLASNIVDAATLTAGG